MALSAEEKYSQHLDHDDRRLARKAKNMALMKKTGAPATKKSAQDKKASEHFKKWITS